MSTTQVIALFGIISLIAFIIRCVRRQIFLLKYSLIWLFALCFMGIICLFPRILTWLARLLGFQLASNALFSLMLMFGMTLMISLTAIVSTQTSKITKLVQENGILEKRVRDLEAKSDTQGEGIAK